MDERWMDEGRLGDWDLRNRGWFLTWLMSERVALEVPAAGIRYRYRQLRPAWRWMATLLGVRTQRVDASRMLFTSASYAEGT